MEKSALERQASGPYFFQLVHGTLYYAADGPDEFSPQTALAARGRIRENADLFCTGTSSTRFLILDEPLEGFSLSFSPKNSIDYTGYFKYEDVKEFLFPPHYRNIKKLADYLLFADNGVLRSTGTNGCLSCRQIKPFSIHIYETCCP